MDERSGAILKSTLTLTRAVSCWYRPKRPELFKSGALPVFMIDDGRDFFYGFPDFGDVGLKCGSHYGTGQIQHADLARQDASAPDENHTRDYLERYMPEGAGPLLGMKTCLYTMTPDTDFIIDTSPEDDRIVVVSPCSKHGFKFAGVVGEIATDLAISGDTGRTSRDSASTDFRPEGCAPHSPSGSTLYGASQAAIDPQVLSGDVTPALGSQKRHGRGDFSGASIAFHGNAIAALDDRRQAVDQPH